MKGGHEWNSAISLPDPSQPGNSDGLAQQTFNGRTAECDQNFWLNNVNLLVHKWNERLDCPPGSLQPPTSAGSLFCWLIGAGLVWLRTFGGSVDDVGEIVAAAAVLSDRGALGPTISRRGVATSCAIVSGMTETNRAP